MKLISCHVENFGKLHMLDMSFDGGVNVICEDNGWGKSSFAAFLKAMFYGLEGERKKNLENERRHYKPWQGGAFGGSITFETEGKRYTASRLFGEKNDADTFVLRDAETNLECTAFSSRLGEELFGIDSESFSRTVFVAQNDCVTGTTDGIDARISSLTDSTDDIAGYDSACNALTKIMNSLNPARATGSISRRRDEITAAERECTEGSNLGEEIARLGGSLELANATVGLIKEQITQNLKEQERTSGLQAVMARNGEWTRLKDAADRAQTALVQAGRSFPGEVPDERVIQKALDYCLDAEKAEERAQLFVQEPEELEEYTALKRRFRNTPPTDEEIARMLEKVATYKRKQAELEESARIKNERASSMRRASIVFLVLGIVFIAAAAGLAAVGAVITNLYMLMGAGLAAIFGIIFTAVGSAKRKKSIPEPDATDVVDAIKSSITGFLCSYKSTFTDATLAEAFYELKSDAGRFRVLQGREKAYRDGIEDRDDALASARGILEEAGFEPEEDLKGQLEKIENAVEACAAATAEYEKAAEALETFERAHEPAEYVIQGSESLRQPDELKSRLDSLNAQLEAGRAKVSAYERELDSLRARYDEWTQAGVRLESLKDIQKSEEARYFRVSRARDYLAQAHERLTAKYSGRIRKGFEHWYQVLGETAGLCHIDANACVTVDEQGMQRETAALSRGRQDLIGMCMRAALVDAMYTQEKPMLVLDDPFVNFDDGRTEQAGQFLEELGRQYQVIYFTCSNSRKPQNHSIF